MNSESEDFYVDDEPVADVLAAWDAGEKGLTNAALRLEPHVVELIEQLAEERGLPPGEVIKQMILDFVAEMGPADRAEVVEAIKREAS